MMFNRTCYQVNDVGGHRSLKQWRSQDKNFGGATENQGTLPERIYD